MRVFRFLLLMALIGVLSTPRLSSAATLNTDWQHAASLGQDPVRVASFGLLDGSGSARFFRLNASTAMTVMVRVDIDASVGAAFSPRLVLYKPDQVTVGPDLPMSQPPATLAAVYPAAGTDVSHEGPWFAALTHSISSSLDLPSAGTYYLAVYNAGSRGGAFRLTLARSAAPAVGFWARVRTWWDTGVWVGPQPATYFFPIAAALIAGLVWYIVHRLPHPAQRRAYAKK